MPKTARFLWRKMFLGMAIALITFGLIESLAYELHEACRLFLLSAICLWCRWHAGRAQ